MKIDRYEQLPVDRIRLDPENIYLHSDSDIARLRYAIETFGLLEALLLDADSWDGETFQLVGGEGRLEVVKGLEWESVWCHIVEFASDDDRRAAAASANERYGRFDRGKLAALIERLERIGYDSDKTGMRASLLSDIKARIHEHQPFYGWATTVCDACGQLIRRREENPNGGQPTQERLERERQHAARATSRPRIQGR